MRVKTIFSEQVWQSPDGEKKIWNVVLEDEQGKQWPLKTFSARVADTGFEGDVESYLNKRGERFVRQQPKAESQAHNKNGSYTRDDAAIKAQWAIGQAINLASATMDKKAITLPVIESYAKELFATVSRVKGEPFTPQMGQEAEGLIHRMAQPAGA